MSDQQVALSNVIDVTILPTPENLGVPNINTAALISQEEPSWFGTKDYVIYVDATSVGVDFGASSNAFAIATEFFAQQPNVLETGGYLVIIPRLQSPSLEATQAAILRTLNKVFYFGVMMDEELAGSAPSTFASLAAYIETLDKMLFYASSNISDLNTGSPLDLLRSGGLRQTRGLYYGNPIKNGANVQQTQMFAAAYAGRALSTDFTGSLTASTMHLKTLAGITPDQSIDQTALNKAQAAGVDVYVSISGLPGLFTSGANSFFDEVYNEFGLKFALETAGFNYLKGTNTKIPQTEDGMDGLKGAYRKILAQFVTNGYAAPGAWNSPDVFGVPSDLIRSVKDIGYYVFSQPVSQQNQSDRAARKAPLVQIAVKTAGAIHSSNVIVNVNL